MGRYMWEEVTVNAKQIWQCTECWKYWHMKEDAEDCCKSEALGKRLDVMENRIKQLEQKECNCG